MNIGGDEAIKVCTGAEAQMNEYLHTFMQIQNEAQKKQEQAKEQIKSSKNTKLHSNILKNPRCDCHQGFP